VVTALTLKRNDWSL